VAASFSSKIELGMAAWRAYNDDEIIGVGAM